MGPSVIHEFISDGYQNRNHLGPKVHIMTALAQYLGRCQKDRGEKRSEAIKCCFEVTWAI
jgi:hypothetical protein